MDMFSASVNQPKTLDLVGKGLINWMHYQIQDPVLREKVRPKFTLGCKRILFSNTYYPALAANNVQLFDQGLTQVTEKRRACGRQKKFHWTLLCGVPDLRWQNHRLPSGS